MKIHTFNNGVAALLLSPTDTITPDCLVSGPSAIFYERGCIAVPVIQYDIGKQVKDIATDVPNFFLFWKPLTTSSK